MDNPTPRGPEELYCPLTLSAPLGPSRMSKVCHKCPLWMHIRGRNPNTGQEIDRWSCSLAQLPIMMVEQANETRKVNAEIHEMRNEQEKQHEEMKRYTGAQVHATRAVHQALTAPAPQQVLLEDKS